MQECSIKDRTLTGHPDTQPLEIFVASYGNPRFITAYTTACSRLTDTITIYGIQLGSLISSSDLKPGLPTCILASGTTIIL
jgi:hypothetical protein